MQQWHKAPKPETAATRRNENKEPTQQKAAISEEGEDNIERHQKMELKIAITSRKRWNTRDTPIWDFWMENCVANSRYFHWFRKNDGLDIEEGLAPSEAEKEAAHGVRAKDVGVPATLGVVTHLEKEKILFRIRLNNV
jgi:hypothetical protein